MSERARRLLGVSPDADIDEIRSAYRRLAKTTHPDLHPNDPEAERRFRDIQNAFVTLTTNQDTPPSARQGRTTTPPSRPRPPTQQPPSPPESTLGVIWWLPVVALVAIMVIIAAVTNDDSAQTPAIPAEVCVSIVDPATGDGEQVECSTPHEISLYERGPITGFSGNYPGEEALQQHTMSLCDRSFRSIMGESPTEAGFRITPRYPTSGEWTAGNRTYDCLAVTQSGEPIQGPLSPGS